MQGPTTYRGVPFIRVRTDTPVPVSNRTYELSKDHPSYSNPCSVCGEPLGSGLTRLVYIGMTPDTRAEVEEGRKLWSNGACIIIHDDCRASRTIEVT